MSANRTRFLRFVTETDTVPPNRCSFCVRRDGTIRGLRGKHARSIIDNQQAPVWRGARRGAVAARRARGRSPGRRHHRLPARHRHRRAGQSRIDERVVAAARTAVAEAARCDRLVRASPRSTSPSAPTSKDRSATSRCGRARPIAIPSCCRSSAAIPTSPTAKQNKTLGLMLGFQNTDMIDRDISRARHVPPARHPHHSAHLQRSQPRRRRLSRGRQRRSQRSSAARSSRA